MKPFLLELIAILCSVLSLSYLGAWQDNQLAGVIGGSGGLNIIPAVIQVFVNHFMLGMEPLDAVQNPRIYHKVNDLFKSVSII